MVMASAAMAAGFSPDLETEALGEVPVSLKWPLILKSAVETRF